MQLLHFVIDMTSLKPVQLMCIVSFKYSCVKFC
jgi:hypothetical protein